MLLLLLSGCRESYDDGHVKKAAGKLKAHEVLRICQSCYAANKKLVSTQVKIGSQAERENKVIAKASAKRKRAMEKAAVEAS